jgi:hypothetical protein
VGAGASVLGGKPVTEKFCGVLTGFVDAGLSASSITRSLVGTGDATPDLKPPPSAFNARTTIIPKMKIIKPSISLFFLKKFMLRLQVVMG